VFALRWNVGKHTIPEVVVVAGDPPAVLEDERLVSRLIPVLAQAPPSPAPPPHELRERLCSAVRRRLADYLSGPSDDDTRRLARRILRRAAGAARARDLRRLRWLDQALNRLTRGLPAGVLKALDDALSSDRPSTLPPPGATTLGHREYASVRLDAALLSDGTLTEVEARRIFDPSVALTIDRQESPL
jgi:hypothetical protein